MERINTINRTWLGIFVLLLIALLLGLRSRNAAADILATGQSTESVAVATASDHEFAAVGQDSILTALIIEERDPFEKHVEKKEPKRRSRRHRKPKVEEKVYIPELLTLLFDSVNPCIHISVEGNRSEWLHVGDEFRGWKVDAIESDSVAVSNGDRHHVLR